MVSVAAEPNDETQAIERMLDDGAPFGVQPRVRKPRRATVRLRDEPAQTEPAIERRPVKRVFRLYCFACGRSSDVFTAPMRPGRCLHCGGTLIVEVAPD